MYDLNHEMMNYDFIEGIEFEGLMPHAIDSIGGVGTNDDQPIVKFMGFEALGHDQMEVVDVEKLFEGEGSGENSGEGSGEGSGEQSGGDDTVNP